MSTSQKKGRNASKVLKVALSAALAAAFTPIAAAPALAAAPTEEQTNAAIDAAIDDANKKLNNTIGNFIVNGSKVYVGYEYGKTSTVTPGQGEGSASTVDTFGSVKEDIAAFLHGLKTYQETAAEGSTPTTITKVKYLNTEYSLDNNGCWAPAEGDALEDVIGGALDNALPTNAADLTLYISTDGTDYSAINLSIRISKATLTHAERPAETLSLEDALDQAIPDETITMVSSAYTTGLSLKEGVTLDGLNRYTITCISTTKGTSAISVVGSNAEDPKPAVVQNLTVVGPNTNPATTDTAGKITRTPDGDSAINSANHSLTLKGVTVRDAESAVSVSGNGAVVTIDGALSVSGNEYAAINLASGGKLALSSKAAVTYADTADTPFACSKGGAVIENKTTAIELAKAVKSSSEIHYYLSSAPANGAAYLYQAKELDDTQQAFNLDGKTEYAMFQFTPAKSGTYCFASGGTTDVAADLYTMTNKGALGSKVASGDNEQGENFRVFAKLTGGSSYILRVGISANAETTANSGSFIVTAQKAEADSLDSYVVTLPSSAYYYSDDKIDVSKLSIAVKSAIDGKSLDSTKYDKNIYAVVNGQIQNGSNQNPVGTITQPGRYALVLTPAQNSGLDGNSEAFCYFDVLDATLIKDYDFKYNNTLVFSANQVASITLLAPKGYRYGKSTVEFSESNVAVMGWYKVTDGVVDNDLRFITRLTTACKNGGFRFSCGSPHFRYPAL